MRENVCERVCVRENEEREKAGAWIIIREEIWRGRERESERESEMENEREKERKKKKNRQRDKNKELHHFRFQWMRWICWEQSPS